MKKLKILIIDDEIAALTKMKVMLAPYGECILANSGKQAVELIKTAIMNNSYFDLITIDIELPDMNGIEILDHIKNFEKIYSKNAIKFMVSASGTTENVINALSRQCHDFLVKPVKKDLLHQKLIKFGLQD